MSSAGCCVFAAALIFLRTPSSGSEDAAVERGQDDPRVQLSRALAQEDLAAVRKAVGEIHRVLGDKAGFPETSDSFQAIPKDVPGMTEIEAKAALERTLLQIEKARWWKIGPDPSLFDHALREPASVVSACVYACESRLIDGDRSLALARDAAAFLIWAQEQAGTGGYPFPAFRGVSKKNEFSSAARVLKRAEQEGRLDQIVRNGWVVEDPGDGGLQYDNGEAGVALLELYELTKEKQYRDSGLKAADWAAGRALVSNWNYNSFSVYLLAKAAQVSGEMKYLAAATHKARIGVIPGQLTEGPHAGRWIDGHNARPAYHYIMLRSLAQLAAALPQGDPDRLPIVTALKLGLIARNREFQDQGASNKDKACEALILVHRVFAGEKGFLDESLSKDTLEALGRLVAEQARRGASPMGPREWAMFLEYTIRTRTR
jgi:hypothetical protein